MSNFNFKVTRLFPGTENQKKVGIHATFNLDLCNDDGIIVSMKDLMLRQSREGKYYLESAFKTYEGKDKEGNAKTQKTNYVKLFPEEKNWSKGDAVVQMVLEELKSYKPKSNTGYAGRQPSSPPTSRSTPATTPSKSSSSDIW